MSKVQKRPPQSYHLDKKIDALNTIDEHDGNVRSASEALGVAYHNLKRWRREESRLRQLHNQRLARRRDRLYLKLQMDMLERGEAVLKRMNTEAVNKAPLNQLATALGSLISHALKLADVIEEIHDEREQVIRFEFDYDGETHSSPPWPEHGDGEALAFQRDRLRTALGQDHARQNGAALDGASSAQTGLVVGADICDGGPGLAGLESGNARDQGRQDQRERAPH